MKIFISDNIKSKYRFYLIALTFIVSALVIAIVIFLYSSLLFFQFIVVSFSLISLHIFIAIRIFTISDFRLDSNVVLLRKNSEKLMFCPLVRQKLNPSI